MKKRKRNVEDCLRQLPFHIVEKCLVEVWVEARERGGVECQEVARHLNKYPSFVTRTETQGRHTPAMELVWMSAAYGLRFMEAMEAWLEKMIREYEEWRKGGGTA